MILSNLSRSLLVFSSALSFSRSSILFFSRMRSLALRSSISLLAAVLVVLVAVRDVAAPVGGLAVSGDLLVCLVAVDVVPEPVSFSRAMVFSWTGLIGWGARISSSLLFGAEAVLLALERLPTGRVLSGPDWELDDVCLMVKGRVTPALAVDDRPLRVREGTPAVLGAAEVETRLVVGLAAGMGGGAIEGRPPVTDGRPRVGGFALEGVLVRDGGAFALDGVVVRDGTPLKGAVPSCLVGDLVGD
jgi:hypothetical protein